MLKVVEAFSGIGSQVKALKNLNIEHEVVSIIEWDINAICAYDMIHNGEQDLTEYENITKEELIERLSKYNLSLNGKNSAGEKGLKSIQLDTLKRIDYAINRTKNLVSITDVRAQDIPDDVDLFTYSFPCQDLSICGSWHNNMTGIDRNANNRSGMLWEVERILKEYVDDGKKLPTFLLMENVSNILSKKHSDNFKEWQDFLVDVGYVNKIYTLNASNFGIPQNRRRTYMVSVYGGNKKINKKIEKYFVENDLEKTQNSNRLEQTPLIEYLRLDYKNKQYKKEADESNPNDTPSRQKIFEDNKLLFDGRVMKETTIKTITTKQDRNPNSGLIAYKSNKKGKSNYRNLTPRECFMLMGFDESDFQSLIDQNFISRKNNFFTREKLIRLAGNSIVVNVLEAIFKQVVDIKENILK